MNLQRGDDGDGFRAVARTILDKVLGVRPDFIELQLAHAVKDPNGRAYNRAAHLPERRKMMQQWADYLDRLKAGILMDVHRPSWIAESSQTQLLSSRADEQPIETSHLGTNPLFCPILLIRAQTHYFASVGPLDQQQLQFGHQRVLAAGALLPRQFLRCEEACEPFSVEDAALEDLLDERPQPVRRKSMLIAQAVEVGAACAPL